MRHGGGSYVEGDGTVTWQFALEIPGTPIPKARARTYTTNMGRKGSYTPKRTRDAEDMIAFAARAKRVFFDSSQEVELEIVFAVNRWRGDIDNLEKLVMDALQKAGVYANDKQVTKKVSEIIRVEKDVVGEFTLVRARAR